MAFWCLDWESRAGIWFVVWATWVLVTDRPGFVLAMGRARACAAGWMGTAVRGVALARVSVLTVALVLVAVAAIGQQTEDRERPRPLQRISVERVVPAELVFDPEVADWAALYRDPPRELVPVGFGRVSVERRSMLRTVSAGVLAAVSAYGVGKAIEGRANGAGWARTGFLLGPSAVGVVSGGLGITRWSHVRQIRRVGW